MNQKLNGGVTVVILIVFIGALLYFGYKQFLQGPPPVSPEETAKMMGNAQNRGSAQPSGGGEKKDEKKEEGGKEEGGKKEEAGKK